MSNNNNITEFGKTIITLNIEGDACQMTVADGIRVAPATTVMNAIAPRSTDDGVRPIIRGVISEVWNLDIDAIRSQNDIPVELFALLEWREPDSPHDCMPAPCRSMAYSRMLGNAARARARAAANKKIAGMHRHTVRKIIERDVLKEVITALCYKN